MRLTCLLFLSASAVAQNPTPPAFDVASVKVNTRFNQNDRTTWASQTHSNPGSLRLDNFNLNMIVAWAYDVQRPQVAGPDWLDSVRFDVVAKTDHPATEPEMRQMMQTLLTERFKLQTHRETRQMDAYVLLLSKPGHKMTESKAETGQNHQDPVRGLVIEGATLAEMMENLARDANVPIVDFTGLKGRFDFTFNTAKYLSQLRANPRSMPEGTTDAEFRLILMQNVLEGELGLRLEPRRTAVEMLVIDHAEKTPVEN